KPIMNGTDTTIAMIASTTVTITASITKAISRRAQWFWTFLSSLSNSKPVGDWTPIVPRTDAPHFQQKPASSRSSLPHFQQHTKTYSQVRTSRHGLKLDAAREDYVLIEESKGAPAADTERRAGA